jgi:hypothetical protein
MIALWLCGLASAGERLDLNRASAADLAAVPGVGGDTAAAIVDLRAKRGRLESVEELRVLHLDDPVLANLRATTSVEVRVPDMQVATYDSVEQVMAQFAGEPTVQQVQLWANEYANTSPRQVERWLAQSVTFATLPQVGLEYRLRNDWDESFDYQNPDGGSPLVGQQDITAVAQDADQGQTQEYKVQLDWELDKLVMSSEKIRIISEAQDIVKLRDKVLSEVTRLYFERRRLQVERLISPKSDLMARVKDELRLMELTANIDALTGGAFSGATPR